MDDVAAETTPEVDPFEAAFAQLTAPEPAAKDPEPQQPASDAAGEAAKAPEGEAAPAATVPPAEQAPAEGDQPPSKSEPPANPPTLPAEEQGLLDRLADAVANKVKPAAPEPPAQPAQPAEPQPQSPFTPEEQQFLTEYEKDFPDIARAEAIRRRAEYGFLVQHVFSQIGQQLAPFVDIVNQLAVRTQHQELTQAVTDYDTVREQVVDWASKQPKYLQDAYAHVIEHGTVDEVRDLVDRWRKETGATIAAPAAGTTAPAPAKKTELPAATKQAAASLAPVSSKRSQAVTGGVDPNDFDAAFAAFSGKA